MNDEHTHTRGETSTHVTPYEMLTVLTPSSAHKDGLAFFINKGGIVHSHTKC